MKNQALFSSKDKSRKNKMSAAIFVLGHLGLKKVLFQFYIYSILSKSNNRKKINMFNRSNIRLPYHSKKSQVLGQVDLSKQGRHRSDCS